MSLEPAIALQFMGFDDFPLLLFGSMLAFGLLLGILLVLFGLSFFKIFDRLEYIVFVHGNAFSSLDLVALNKNSHTGSDGDQTAEGDPHACAPGGAVESIPVPHPNTKQDLKECVEHVHMHHKINGP